MQGLGHVSPVPESLRSPTSLRNARAAHKASWSGRVTSLDPHSYATNPAGRRRARTGRDGDLRGLDTTQIDVLFDPPGLGIGLIDGGRIGSASCDRCPEASELRSARRLRALAVRSHWLCDRGPSRRGYPGRNRSLRPSDAMVRISSFDVALTGPPCAIRTNIARCMGES